VKSIAWQIPLGTSVLMIVLIIRYEWLLALTNVIGAVLPTTTLFLGSILFLILLAVQFSMKISALSNQVKDLVQENALLRYEFAQCRQGIAAQQKKEEPPQLKKG